MAVWTSIAGVGLAGLGSMGDPGPPVHPLQILTPAPDDSVNVLVDGLRESGSTEAGPPNEDSTTETQQESVTIEAPPELSALADFSTPPELPEIPNLPPPAIKPVVDSAPKPSAGTKGASKGGQTGTPSRGIATGNGSGSGNGKGTGVGNGAAPGAGLGGNDNDRLKKGHFVRPVYPPSCDKAGIIGTVIVEFTVDPSGKVSNARVAKSSSNAELDTAAVNSAYRWSFPAGSQVSRGQLPVRFERPDH